MFQELCLFLDAAGVVLSSAKLLISEFFNNSSNSLRNISKKIGSCIDPWGTPEFKTCKQYSMLSILTLCLLLFKCL